jgi:cytochrome c6
MIKILSARRLVVTMILLVPLVRPPLSSADQTDAGALYKKKCATCHGINGVPKKFAKGSADFSDTAWKDSVSQEDLEKMISQGKGRMPSFQDRLTEDQIRALAAYLKTL